jgi:hypothetical protein
MAEEDDVIPPEARAAIEAARKNAENSGVEIPDLEALMKDEEGVPSDDGGAKVAPTAKEPLDALPSWIPAVPGFRSSAPGSRWTEDGMAKGEMSGIAPGKARELAEEYAQLARPKFRGVTTNDVTINGALTMTVFISNLVDEQAEHRAEVEIKPAADGKDCEVTVNYSEPVAAK